MVSASGVARWEYRDKYLDGVSSDLVPESEALDSFTPLQLELSRLMEPQPAKQQAGIYPLSGRAAKTCPLE